MATALDRVLALAADSGTSEEEVHEHLARQCPWYTAVSKGENPGDPETSCKPAGGKVKLTPRTAEASTVPEPIGKPNGPGLWHVKGMQLPPYVQHLAHHLIGKYGESRGIAMAKGIVAKWKQGINPGGRHKDGKVSHVHPDVQAAASKAIAQWEQKREIAHEQSREHAQEHVKATVTLAAGQPAETKQEAHYRAGGTPGHRCGDCSMFRPLGPGVDRGHCTLVKGDIDQGAVCDEFEPAKGQVKLAAAFPGDKEIPLPPVPHDKTAAAMFTAHRTGDIINQMSHAAERVIAAQKASTPALRHYYSIHIANHATLATRSAHQLAEAMRRNYPAETRELDRLNEVASCSASVSPKAKVASFAHLVQTILYNLGHAKRHADALLDDNPGDEKVWQFNLDHASRHINGTLEHALKFAEHLRDNYPAEAHWLKVLEGFQGNEAGEQGRPAEAAKGAERTIAKVDKTDAGYDKKPGGTVKLAVPAATAPGAKPIKQPNEAPPDYGLFRKAYTPAGAPIALPPGASLPTVAEIHKLVGMVPDCSDPTLATSARKHLVTAAMQLERNSVLDALATLRSAQMDAFAGHKTDLGAAGQSYYTANVFEKTVPPAETSSAHASMIASQQRRMDWRKLQQGIALAIDKIKRHFFHGQLGSWNTQARFTQEAEMDSSLDKVLRLAAGLEEVGLAGAPPRHIPAPAVKAGVKGAPAKAPVRTPVKVGGSKPAARPDAHVQHVQHEEHLAHLHAEHVAHLAHVQHVLSQHSQALGAAVRQAAASAQRIMHSGAGGA